MKRSTLVAIAAFVVAPLALVVVLSGAVALYGSYVTRDFQTWEANGPAPIKQVLYYAHGPRVTELFIMTVPGTRLKDVADMSLFGPAVPGLSPAQFRRRYGASVLTTPLSTIRAVVQEESSLGASSFRLVLHATPRSDGIPVARVFHRVIAGRIAAANLSGPVHIHNGASTGFLTCQIIHAHTVTLLRWHGAA